MANLGTAYVQIVPAATGIKGKISKAIAPEAALAGSKAGTTIATGIGSKMATLGKGILKAGLIAGAVAVPIIAGVKKAMGAYEVQNAAETKLTEIYKTRMGVSKKAAQATIDYAGVLQKSGVVGDEVMLSGAQQLATFAKYPKTVNSLLPAMNNLLVQQKGLNGTQQDATQIANLMGKVIQGQTGALKRVGISFTDAEEKVLKYGSEQERAAMLAKVITNNVGNMNKAMAQTPEGKIQQMKNSFGDLAEQIGATLAPALGKAASWISANLIPKVQEFIAMIQSSGIGEKISAGIQMVFNAISAVMPIVSSLASFIMEIVTTVMTALMPVIQQLMPIISMIGSFIASIMKSIFSSVVPVVKSIIAVVVPVVVRILSIVAAVLPRVLAVVSNVLGRVKAVFTTIWNAIGPIVKGAIDKIKSFIDGLKVIIGKVRDTFNRVRDAIKAPIEKAKDIVKGIIDKIKNLFPLKIGKIFDGIQLPHISVEGGKAPFGIGGKGSLPHFSVRWAAKGGLVDGATIIGAGEKGQEAIVPLDPFWNRLDEDLSNSRIDYDRLAMAMVTALQSMTMVNELVCDGRTIAKAAAPFIQTETDTLTRRQNRKLGYA